MALITVTREDTNLIPGLEIIGGTTTGTTSTYQTKKFAEIVAVFATNESDDDGVAISWSGQTITIVVSDSGDKISLVIAGRK